MQKLAPQRPVLGISLMISAMVCFAAMTVAVRWTSELVPTGQMVFIRNIISLVLIVSWVFIRYDASRLATNKRRRHFLRAAVGFCAMETWFFSLSVLPVTFATALSFTTPVFGTILAIIYLKERAGWRRWCAIGTGFFGMLIILNPASDEMSYVGLIVILSSLLMAISGTLVKTLTRTEKPETIVFYMSLFMTPLSLPIALVDWQPLSLAALTGIAFIAVCSTTAHLLLTRAFLNADMVVLMPFDFLRLIFTAIFAYLLFAETMSEQTLIGAAVIMGSAAYITYREARKHKRATVSLPNSGG